MWPSPGRAAIATPNESTKGLLVGKISVGKIG
jgi:hypothetical protein